MKLKAIFIDLDGTTLEKNKVNISEQNQKAIQKAMEHGIKVIPCTGRVLDMFPPDLEAIKGIEYAITCHGGRALDLKSGKCLYQNTISSKDSVEIMKIIEKKGIYCETACNNTLYFEKEVVQNWREYPVPAHHFWYLEMGRGIGVDSIADYFAANELEIEKINIYGMRKELQAEIYALINATNAIRHTNEGVSEDLEFLTKTINKREAVDCLLNYLSLDPKETMMIGDSNSDIELIRYLGFGVAMGNAPDYIKEQADYVTAPCEENGVAKAIKYKLEECDDKDGLV
ncbi:HAD family hydrolase [Clostridiales bacterium COT073_COT-073]|nr:HAD family hydrolase [Clostridiales bacterium COT073_COT-073]